MSTQINLIRRPFYVVQWRPDIRSSDLWTNRLPAWTDLLWSKSGCCIMTVFGHMVNRLYDKFLRTKPRIIYPICPVCTLHRSEWNVRDGAVDWVGIICLFWSMWSVGNLQKICWCLDNSSHRATPARRRDSAAFVNQDIKSGGWRRYNLMGFGGSWIGIMIEV